MPDRATIEASSPRCNVFSDPKPRKGGTVTERCTRTLQWDHNKGWWVCPQHDAVLSGEEAAGWLEEAA